MHVNVDTDRLVPPAGPMRCAKSGVPTTLVRTHVRVYKAWPPWWVWVFVLGWPLSILYAYAFGAWRVLRIPISREVRRQNYELRALRAVVLVGGYLAVTGPLRRLQDPVLLAVVATWLGLSYWLHRQVRDSWVAPRYYGGVVRLRAPHPDFVAAARGGAPARDRAAFAAAQPLFDTRPEPAPAPVPAPAPAPVPALPPPGWYPDPGGTYAARWFDGRGWTEQVMGVPGTA